MSDERLKKLNTKISGCTLCPRLVQFREMVPVRPQFRGEEHWRRPISGFGDPGAWLLILGLAPSAQGGNRTGRLFTGDGSGVFLMRTLYKAGFANHPTSEKRDDGLILKGCYLTAAVKCVPPDNRPTREEFTICRCYLDEELKLLRNLKCVLALGKLAFDCYQKILKEEGVISSLTPFKHGALVEGGHLPNLVGSYHPSPQNTQTGLLTDEMLIQLLKRLT